MERREGGGGGEEESEGWRMKGVRWIKRGEEKRGEE